MSDRRFVVGLDIGTSKIAIAWARLNPFASVESFGFRYFPSQGIKQGRILDLGSLSNSLKQALSEVQDVAKHKIRDVYLGLSGHYLKAKLNRGISLLSERRSRPITQWDIQKVERQAASLGLDLNEVVIHQAPLGYIVDGDANIRNPLGLHGRRLEVLLYLLTSKVEIIEDMREALAGVGCRVEDFVFWGYACYLALKDKLKELGNPQEQRTVNYLLLDVGASLTKIARFEEGILRQIASFSWGGEDLTYAIAQRLGLSFSLAEELKKAQGALNLDEINLGKELMIKKGHSFRSIKRREIVEVLKPSVKNILNQVKRRFFSNLAGKKEVYKVIITGGGSLLNGFLEMSEEILGMPVEMGMVKDSEIPASQIPIFAEALGLVRYGIDLRRKKRIFSKGGGLPAQLLHKLKEIYREYF